MLLVEQRPQNYENGQERKRKGAVFSLMALTWKGGKQWRLA